MATNNFVRLSGKLAMGVDVLVGAKGGEYAKIKLNVNKEGRKGYDQIEVVVFNPILDTIKDLKKGHEVYIEGTVNVSSFKPKGSNKEFTTASIIANVIKVSEENSDFDVVSDTVEIIDTINTGNIDDEMPF